MLQQLGLNSAPRELLIPPRMREMKLRASYGGVLLELQGQAVSFDSKKPQEKCFVSHAHLDHLPSRSCRCVCSPETAALARLRGVTLLEDSTPQIKLLDAGHVLGSRAALIEDFLLFTGDICLRSRGFMEGFKPVKAQVLVIESTYGSSSFQFPDAEEVAKEARDLIEEMLSRGHPVVLMGYPLGKAQILIHFFSSIARVVAHSTVAKFTEVYRRFGVDLPDVLSYPKARLAKVLERESWVMLTPMYSSTSPLIQALKRRHGVKTMAFSGWAVTSSFKAKLGADYAFPLSDHADFHDLLKVVEAVSPELVVTYHGQSSSLARALRQMGFAAESLAEKKAIDLSLLWRR
ncbi:MAG: hypothetical protein DRN99_00295 [Thermoproteota archaeon]|nr:MAG: hypothetical protein DRN99_00295 [Candidatus Korarchaeota archaeon]